ncbi:GNAT family N-acetyltransferase [Streptomyces sp. NPDC016566]|uniref:GNAT family N-acetyltransferase n=1 Tax=Streptomyces sp. NPDC016566 TaxID=3364967 RepID=UPI0036F58231
MTTARIAFGLGEHEDAANALLRSEWPLAELPSPVNEPRFWTMTCPDVSGLSGLAVVANGFKGAQAADDPRPYWPVLEYLVIDRRARDRQLGRRLARHVLQEVSADGHEVIVEVERERVDAIRFWTQHLQCAVAPDSEQTAPKVLRLCWTPTLR